MESLSNETSVEDASNENIPPGIPSIWSPSAIPLHPQAEEIIRQVDYYFSEENLRADAHLLGLIQEGKGTVSLNEILGFKKMRKFKPKSVVREALKQSKVVEVVGTKRLKRREPLTVPVYVAPKINRDRKKIIVPEDKPWLTKGLLKPTGFEDYATDGPIRPEEYERDREAFDPEISITSRMEKAVARFCARRKMHSAANRMFTRFLCFGGFDAGQRQFAGGLDEKSMQDSTKREIAELSCYYEVSDEVVDGLCDDGPDKQVTWVVDFEGVAKGFLSSQLLALFDWYNLETVETATTVLRSFYNYLLHHDVCPEYNLQIYGALAVCDVAASELPQQCQVDWRLPGDFNVACSMLFGGWCAGTHAIGGDWLIGNEKIGFSDKDAYAIFAAGIAAYGSEEQVQKLQAAAADGRKFEIIASDETGIEVVGVEMPQGKAKEFYDDPRLTNTILRPIGKLYCKRWDMPHVESRYEAWSSAGVVERVDTFEFLVDELTLHYCYVGLKMDVAINELDLGIKWIDVMYKTYASFFTWLPNEYFKDYPKTRSTSKWLDKMEERQKNAERENHDDENNQTVQEGEVDGEKNEMDGEKDEVVVVEDWVNVEKDEVNVKKDWVNVQGNEVDAEKDEGKEDGAE